MNRLKDMALARIGVNRDPHEKWYSAEVAANRPQGALGPIAMEWGVRTWSSIYVVDHKGVIRFMKVCGQEMDTAIDQRLEEMQQEEKARSR